uniref:Uncharacterized protein n=1 Tax=Magallana gigas TaxID=29159 RepID=K1QGV7_MAGGI
MEEKGIGDNEDTQPNKDQSGTVGYFQIYLCLETHRKSMRRIKGTEGTGNSGGGTNGGGGSKNWGMDHYTHCDKLSLASELRVVIYLKESDSAAITQSVIITKTEFVFPRPAGMMVWRYSGRETIGYKAELLEVTGLQFSAVLLIRNKIKSFGMLPDS